jgi:hypothetical protein
VKIAENSDHSIHPWRKSPAVAANNAEAISPVVLYAALGTCGTFIVMLIVLAVLLLRCRSNNVLLVDNTDLRPERKNYLKTDGGTGTREKLNPPPPDLWIGHDQVPILFCYFNQQIFRDAERTRILSILIYFLCNHLPI